VSETFALSPVQCRILNHAGADMSHAEYDVSGASDVAIAKAMDALAARWEILRTRFPVPAGRELPVQEVGGDPAWTYAIDAGRVRISLPALAMDRAGYALMGTALAAELAGRPILEGPQYLDVAAWLDDLAAGPDGEAGRRFWAQAGAPDDGALAASVPIPPPGHSERLGDDMAPVPEGLAGLTERWGQPVETVLLAAWHVLLQRLTDQTSSWVAVTADGRAQPALQQALGPLTRWLPGELVVDLAAPFAAVLPGLATRVAQQLAWQDCTVGGDARFGFRVAPALGSFVRLLSCSLPDEPHALRLVVDGDTLRVEGEGGAYVMRALAALLDDLVARPDAPVSQLAVMPISLHDRLVVAFNATARLYPATDAATLFAAACDRDSDAIAVVDGGLALSYGALDAQANALAARLEAHGIGPESRVGLLAPRSVALVAGCLGILKSGAAFVPLDPANPPARRDWIAADAGLAAVLYAPGQTPPPGTLALALNGAVSARTVRPQPHPESLAYVLHTSGSTGRPKGVAVTQGGLANYLLWAGDAYRPEAGRGVPVHTSPAFDLTLTALLLPLTRGQRLDLLGGRDALQDLARGLATAADWSFVKLTPSHLKALGDQPAKGGTRRLVVGGEALFGEQLQAWATVDPNLSVINEYGPTETVVGCAVYEARAANLPPGAVPIGHPIANATVLVLDRFGGPVPPGVAGEGWIGGAGVARGYLGRPDLTADRFRPDPAGPPGARAYRSGDLLRHRWEGGLDYLGRGDEQLKIAGHRIEPAEVEAALLRLDGVDQAAVVRDGDRLLGFVVADAGTTLDPDVLRARLLTVLPPWMVPARLRVITVLPLAASGKADRAALLALPALAQARTRPRTLRETVLAKIWSGVLGREVGVEDDFFQLGGDSILGLQVVARARRAGLALPPDAVFRHPTVARQAAAAEAVLDRAGSIPEGPWFSLHPIQARFLDFAAKDPWHETQTLLLAPPTLVTLATLATALAQVQRRHGMLRARFGRDTAGRWQQRIDPLAPDPAPETADVRGACVAELEAFGLALRQGLNLADGPVWRAALVDRTQGQAILLTAHHLVIDRVSWGPLLDDLQRALMGETLDPPPPGFDTWVAALRTAVLPTDIEASMSLPSDEASLGPALHRLDRALPLPARWAVPREADLVAALARSLVAWAGWDVSQSVAIEIEHHGRDARALGVTLDVSQTVGWFTAIAAVTLRGDATAEDAEAALAAQPGRGLAAMLVGSRRPAGILFNHLGQFDAFGGPFAQLAASTGPDRSLQRPAEHAITLVTSVAGGALHCRWSHTAQHQPSHVERLARLFERQLLTLSAPEPVMRRPLPPGALAAIVDMHGPVEAVLPATALQQGMLYHTALDPEGGAYIEQTSLRFDGPLDPAALRAAWTALMRRHAALRTLFVPDLEGLPAQVVLRDAVPDWIEEDWTGPECRDPDAALAALLATDRTAGFDLKAAPPLRFRLLRLGASQWCFVWTSHHALLDGWSLQPLLGELYALADGRELPPPPDPVAVSDYLVACDSPAGRRFWAELLRDAAPTPTGARDAATPPRATARRDRRLPAGPFLAAARAAAVTPATLVATAWGLTLAHDAGQDEALFAMSSSGRSPDMPGAERAIGLFLTTLPVRLRLDRAAAPAVFLQRLQAELAAARHHEHCLIPTPNLATTLLTFENYPADPSLAAVRPGAPRIVALDTVQQSSFALSLLAGLEQDELVLSLRFDPARFDSDAAAARLNQVARILAALGTAASLEAALPSSTASAWEHGPAVTYPIGGSLADLVLGQAANTPEATAVQWGDAAMSYAELVRRAQAAAAGLQAAGVQRGDVVGLMTERCEALLPALLGTLLVGAAWCPLEPDQPPLRRAIMARDANLRVVLAGPGMDVPTGCIAVSLDLTGDWSCGPKLAGTDTAYVMFTSGSTGRPKGVAVSHAAIVNRLGWMQRLTPIGPGDVVLQKTPLGFDVSVWELFWPLQVGATLALAPPDATRDPVRLAATMQHHAVTVLHFVPALLRLFLDEPGIETRCGTPRLVFTSGEALTADLVSAWRSQFAVPLHNLYGPTEAAVDVTGWTCDAPEAVDAVPIGRPADNVVARVLDGAMRRVPAGARGALWLGGVQLATAYVNAPALTADAFRPDPFGPPGARLYCTGDRASWRADGALLYGGRNDTQVKLRGVRIETAEIEAVLLGHPALRNAAVALVNGELVAWVAPRCPADLAAFLADRLPLAMRPSRVVALARLPLTYSGKVDRRALDLPARDRAAMLPRGALEGRLAALAATVLGTWPGPGDDLFALGLHSLAAVQLINLIRRELGAAPSLSALYAHCSIAGLAQTMSRAFAPGGSVNFPQPTPLVMLRRGTDVPYVLVHPVGGDIACFLRLASRLDGPVLALQSRGLLGGHQASSIAVMADDYAGVVAAAVPGQIRLVGYSMGCAVAFEMACRLGDRVDRLVLLDGSAEQAPAEWPALADLERELASAQAGGLLPASFGPEDAQRIVDAARSNQRALAAWQPARANIAATLLRARPSTGFMGWDRLMARGLVVHDIDATHEAMLEEANVSAVAAAMRSNQAVPTGADKSRPEHPCVSHSAERCSLEAIQR
jgi:amino acid adenylation domain-containing protein